MYRLVFQASVCVSECLEGQLTAGVTLKLALKLAQMYLSHEPFEIKVFCLELPKD